jgi:DNA-3-methyladenine glycosylase
VSPEPLPQAFYARDTRTVARDLLGRLIVSTIGGARCVGRIVETEAYLGPHDPASHAAGWRRTARNDVMYREPGALYVYFTYGMHWCANVVTGREGFPAAVLLRAVEPLEGLAVMRRRRGGVPDRLLAAGPARLTQALGIAREHNGHDLARPPLWIAEGTPVPRRRQVAGPRVGIRVAVDWKLRFAVKDCLYVSGARAKRS